MKDQTPADEKRSKERTMKEGRLIQKKNTKSRAKWWWHWLSSDFDCLGHTGKGNASGCDNYRVIKR